MRAGYASGAPKTTISQLPGYKSIAWREDPWMVVDAWAAGERGSAGSTTIFYREDEGKLWLPVWAMHYAGIYKEEVIPFLKRALLATYARNEFVGGRGPVRYIESGEPRYEYYNRTRGTYLSLDDSSGFAGFEGNEQILGPGLGPGGVSLGFHVYFGMMLVPFSE